jgi:D-3-phosphoglycerate dehydrogenase / 2-oxoglutarate reductase
MKNILITTSSFAEQTPDLLAILDATGFKAIMNPYGRKLAESEVDALIQEFRPVGIIAGVEPITRPVLANAPYLKVISRCGIGMDSVDLKAAAELGITVTNTPDAPTLPVAELTIGMILSLLRSIHLSDASIRSGGWERPMGSLLHGKTVGIIGCGRIGSCLAKLLTVFDCRILGCDITRNEYACYSLDDIATVFAQSDVVTLHIPYTRECHHFIDSAHISMMKRGAVLVNASRGGLIDEEALYKALQSGHLSGAALDCFEDEPYNGPLKELKNTLLTGHIGSYAKEARMMMEKQAVDNLLKELEKWRSP